ncbi:MAG: sugar ABC transporter permease [Erysipelotrichaceae bacterium]|nr:sugar ABC transporter permease [Erysipelotrichaceae bacterium]MDD3810288.1 sugar ABC transporter permease [Erysipelotrichaceae bacterium]
MKDKLNSNRSRTFLAITIPIVILFFVFNTMAVIQGFGYSLTNFKGFGGYDFVGLRNYIDLFSDERIINSYIFTFGFAIICTILVNIISLVLALGLSSKIRAQGALRAIYFLPNILGGLVIGYVFNFFFTYILPGIGEAINSGALSNSLLASPKTAWFALVITVAWQAVALNTLIYISGLQTVPEDVYEAGAIDGAVGFKKFKNITFPLIMPFFTINMVLCMKNFLMVFDQVVSLTGGGPARSTESISFLIYSGGLSGGAFGYQSANAVIFFVVIVTISIFQLRFLNSKEEQL